MNLRSLFSLLVIAVSAASAQAAPLSVSLDFNDNVIPAGWAIHPGPLNVNSNYGVANGRFYAGQVDSSAFLDFNYAPSAGVTALDLQWDGSVFQTYWGNNQGMNVVDSSGTAYLMRAESNSYLYGNGVLIYQGASGIPEDKLALADGTYRFHARFTDNSIQFSAALNGAEVFNRTNTVAGFALRDLRAIELVVYETVGPQSWLDNVTISEQVSSVPELSSSHSLAAGLLAVFAVLTRRGRQAF